VEKQTSIDLHHYGYYSTTMCSANIILYISSVLITASPLDILSLIREQILEIKKLSSTTNLDEIILHIERAEFYYIEGKSRGDDHYYTDVIYRTNQAFEGSLKQSYVVLAGKTETQVERKRTIEIEDFFEKNQIFNERVLHFFKNYRKDWRNTATHDFKLFFNQSEAFLAITNVSSYMYLLFNQMIEKLAFENEKARLIQEKGKQKIISQIINDTSLALDEKVVELIKEFSYKNEHISDDVKELEILGMFSAFVSSTASAIEAFTDVEVSGGTKSYRLDMLIVSGNERVVLEIKQPGLTYEDSHHDQVDEYLEATGLHNGILWYPKPVWEKKLLDIDNMVISGREIRHITTIK
jgi:hypothetical protein